MRRYKAETITTQLGNRRLRPEEKLQLAILERALLDLGKPLLRKAALDWMREDIPGHPFSFPAICAQFRLDPEATRDALEKRKSVIYSTARSIEMRRVSAIGCFNGRRVI